MAAIPPVCDFGWQAPEFSLPATDGKTYGFKDVAGPNGTLIMFICNHCPYVLAVLEQIKNDAAELRKWGVGVAAINANDAVAYPADSFENMKKFDLGFPYLYDESQTVARGYDAMCTPDFFGFDANGGLQYRGRLGASRKQAGGVDPRRDLFEAMRQVAETGKGPAEQVASMGCSIKWKDV